jgi:hypothetical protein
LVAAQIFSFISSPTFLVFLLHLGENLQIEF